MKKQSLLLDRLKSCIAKSRTKIVEEAVDTHMQKLPQRRFPSGDEISAGSRQVTELIKTRLFRDGNFRELAEQLDVTEDKLEESLLCVWRYLPKLNLPEPARQEQLPGWKLALVAAIGSILGLLILTPVTRLALGMRDIGILLGGPLGSFGSILFVLWLSHHKWVRRILPFLAAGGGLTYIYASVKGTLFWKKQSSLKATIVSAGIIAAAWLAKTKIVFDKDSYRESVRSMITYWFNCAVYLSVAYCCTTKNSSPLDRDREQVLAKLAQYIYILDTTPEHDRNTVVEEMIQEAQNLGFEGIKKDERFYWQADHESCYRTYGEIQDGDQVYIEEPAVFYKGEPIVRGLVRKVRSG